jgi:hypothetical protein
MQSVVVLGGENSMITRDTDRGSAFGGAILLMATVIVVVLTTAIFFGNFSFDSQQTEMPEPEVAFDYTDNPGGSDVLLIRHREGARINPLQFSVKIEGASCTGDTDPDGEYSAHSDFGLAEDNWVSPGMALIVDDDNPVQMCETGDFSLEGATVTLLWENPDGEYQTMTRWEN